MDNTIQQPAPAPAVPAPAPAPAVEPTPAPIVEPSYANGGYVGKLDKFTIVMYAVFALFIVGQAYKITYYRKALNELNDY